MKTIVLKVRNLPNSVDTDLFVYCMQQDVAVPYPRGKVELVPEIVRCKDCKHGEPCNEGDVDCNKDIGTFKSTVHKPEWFCADAERKSEDD